MASAWRWTAHAAVAGLLSAALLTPALVSRSLGAEDEVQPGAKAPQLGSRVGEGLGREGMWPAPTDADWAKPCLLTWQRTWDDAVSVSKETGKPILVCINMDGEIASEHYAGHRYRQPEVAALYAGYVTVIASVYRHTPRDYDDAGQRIPCPRFGGVTCGEHIAIEPVIYEKFCNGERVAPRHIAVSLDGEEVYDVYYTNDTASVFDAIREGRAKLPAAKPPSVRGDRPIEERVASPDVRDRLAVESAYKAGDAAAKKRILDAAVEHAKVGQLDLLRLALFGLDVDRSRAARKALATVQHGSSLQEQAVALMGEAMRTPMDDTERDALIAALKKLGDTSRQAQWLAAVHRGLADSSQAVDLAAWSAGKRGDAAREQRLARHALVARMAYQAQRLKDEPKNGEAVLDVAQSAMDLAFEGTGMQVRDARRARQNREHFLAEAAQRAREAEALGTDTWRTHAILAIASYYGGDKETAYPRAERAIRHIPPGDTSWLSMSLTTVFAEARWMAIKQAVKAKKDWPPRWLSDLNAAYRLLREHPLGTETQVLWHDELLMWVGARRRALRAVQDGLARWPASAALHKRLRKRVLERGGPGALERVYERLTQHKAHGPTHRWFAAVAAVEAADQLRRTRRNKEARSAYGRALARYEAAAKDFPQIQASADHACAFVLAARARVAYQLDDLPASLTDMLASLQRGPDVAGSRDAMGITPGETAQVLLARLQQEGRTEDAASLDAALKKIDPELLRPDRP